MNMFDEYKQRLKDKEERAAQAELNRLQNPVTTSCKDVIAIIGGISIAAIAAVVLYKIIEIAKESI